jgi:hypothetical protein
VDDEIVEVENDPISSEEEVEEIEDPESETLNEDTKSENRYWICFYDNNDVAVIEAADEDEAMNTFMNDYNDEYFFDSWDHDWFVDEISKEEYDEWEETHSILPPELKLKLTEHVNEEHPAIESDQELEGTDNAVVDCKVADVVTHSEDEKPVDCKGEKKPLSKPLTEDFGIYFKNPADWDEFKRLCDEIGILTMGDIKRFMEEEGATPDTILDVLRNYRKELGDDFEIRESLYNFTEEEMAEYNMDEDGVSLDSYDEYVRCNWCGEVFTAFDCEFEADLGWLCDRCYSAIRSRGEKLTIIKNPTDEDIAKTLTEEVEMTKQELKDKFGTDDVDLINAGREEENRVTLKETSGEPVEDGISFEDLPEETRKEIEEITKFVNDAIANKTTVTAADIKRLRNKNN